MKRKVWIASLVLALGACGDDDGPIEEDMFVPGDAATSGTDMDTPEPDMDTDTPDMDTTDPCGNGTLDTGEACDTGIAAGEDGACPTSCDDGDPCTTDALEGTECAAVCTVTTITDFVDGDSCCPSGGTVDDDSDCFAECGNGTVEPGETCDDGNTTPGDGCDDACQLEPGLPTAMRITSMAIRDPHVFFSCSLDVTNTANMIFQDEIDMYGLNTVGVWRPLDPAAAATPMDVFPEAACAAGTPQDSCMATPGAVSTIANNQSTGVCYAADPSTLSYAATRPNEPTDNCFVSDPATVTINLNGAMFVLEDATVAGEYAPGQINNGVLAGFVSYATAMAVLVPNPLGGSPLPLYDLLRGGACTGNDADPRSPGGADAGWWFYIDFEAEEVTWSE